MSTSDRLAVKAVSAEPACSGLLPLKHRPSVIHVRAGPHPLSERSGMAFAPLLCCGCLRAHSRPYLLEPTAETIHPALALEPGTVLGPSLTSYHLVVTATLWGLV